MARGGTALGGRPGVSLNKAAIGGSGIEFGGRGGQGAAGFRIAKALETSPLRAGINKAAIGSEKMTVIGGQPVVRRPGPAEFMRTPNISAERFTAPTGHMLQRRAAGAPERRTGPVATNKQLEKALGTRIGEFNPSVPKGIDLIQRGNGKYSLPPENTVARPVDTRVQEAALLNKIREAYARPGKVDLTPGLAPVTTQPARTIELASPKPEAAAPVQNAPAETGPRINTVPELRPQSPRVAGIMAELNRIGEKTRQQAVKAKGALRQEPMAAYPELEKKVVSLKKEADKKVKASGDIKRKTSPVEEAISLLKKKNDARTGIASGVIQSRANPFDRLGMLIRKKIKEAEEEEDKTKKKLNVVPLRPTDPRKPGLAQPEQTDGKPAPVMGVGVRAPAHAVESPAATVQGGNVRQVRPTEEVQPLRKAAAIELPALTQKQPESKSKEDNVIFIPDSQKAPQQPDSDNPVIFSVARDVLEARTKQTLDSLGTIVLQRGWDAVVSGSELTAESNSATTSPIVAKPGDDPSDVDRITQIHKLSGRPRELITDVISLNNVDHHLPAKIGRGMAISRAQVRRIARGKEEVQQSAA